jgi:hypothetical protein
MYELVQKQRRRGKIDEVTGWVVFYRSQGTSEAGSLSIYEISY